MPKVHMVIVFCAGLLAATFGSAQDMGATDSPTLKNLQSAYNGEYNETACYGAFAAKADEEGYKGAASLFRAAAKAESVHLGLHAGAIEKLGAEPKAEVETPVVKSTKENLYAAMTGEEYERDAMYPAFFEQAQVDHNTDAARSFKNAMLADIEHAKLFKQALDDVDAWTDARTFLVCSDCGFTSMDLTLTQCPVCAAPREKLLDVD
jgi:rubrerythrin